MAEPPYEVPDWLLQMINDSENLSPDFKKWFVEKVKECYISVETCCFLWDEEWESGSYRQAPEYNRTTRRVFCPYVGPGTTEFELMFYEKIFNEEMLHFDISWRKEQREFIKNLEANQVELLVSFSHRGDALINTFLTDEANKVPCEESTWLDYLRNKDSAMNSAPYVDCGNRLVYEFLHQHEDYPPPSYSIEASYDFLFYIREHFMDLFAAAPRLEVQITLFRGHRVAVGSSEETKSNPRISSFTIDPSIAAQFALAGTMRWIGEVDSVESVVHVVTFPVGTPSVFMHGCSYFHEAEVIVPPIFMFETTEEKVLEITCKLPDRTGRLSPETYRVRCLFMQATICPPETNVWVEYLFGDASTKDRISGMLREPAGGHYARTRPRTQ